MTSPHDCFTGKTVLLFGLLRCIISTARKVIGSPKFGADNGNFLQAILDASSGINWIPSLSSGTDDVAIAYQSVGFTHLLWMNPDGDPKVLLRAPARAALGAAHTFLQRCF